MSKKRKIYIGVLAFLIIIQFFKIDKTVPESPPNSDFLELEKPPQQVADLIKNACYDCHSHQTEYPSYSNFQPLGFFIKGHIKGGRQKLNFSLWGTYDSKKKAHKMEEIAEEVLAKNMPMKSYTWLHPEAKITETDRKLIADWARKSAPQ